VLLRLLAEAGALHQLLGEVGEVEPGLLAQDHHPLDDVLQLADVSRPAVAEHAVHGFGVTPCTLRLNSRLNCTMKCCTRSGMSSIRSARAGM
jgi:hypothetical protein